MKRSGYLQRQQIKQAIREESARRFAIQQSLDMALIALGDEFGFGPDRAARFHQAFCRVFMEYANLCLGDAKADKDVVYTKEVVDRKLKEICGDNFVPWETRYGEVQK